MERRAGIFGVIVAVLFSAGCVNTPVERQEATHDSLAELRDTMTATRTQIETTLGSLVTLMNAPPDGLRDPYRDYARNADIIARQAKRVEAESGKVRQRSDNWLSKWKQSYAQIDDPELRRLTEQRREQVLSRFENIEGSLRAAREAFQPLVKNLQDIKQVVGNDLTPNGIAAVRNTAVVQNATDSGAQAANALEVTIADLDALLEAVAPAPAS